MRIIVLLTTIFMGCMIFAMNSFDSDAYQKEFENLGQCNFTCEVANCKKFFTSLELLCIHQKIHRTLYICCMPKCQKIFSKKDELKNHTLRKHAIVHQFLECNHQECGKIFVYVDDLINHMEEHSVRIPQKRPRHLDLFKNKYMVDPEAQKKRKIDTSKEKKEVEEKAGEMSDESSEFYIEVGADQIDLAYTATIPRTP